MSASSFASSNAVASRVMGVAAVLALLLTQVTVAVAQPGWTGVVTDPPPGLRPAPGQSGIVTVATDAAGNAFCIWHPNDRATFPYSIRVVRFNAAVKAWEWNQAVELSPGGWDPVVSMNSSGDAIAVWVERETFNVTRLRAARFTTTGSAGWSPAVTIATGAVDSPRIAIDPASNAVAMWKDRNNGSARAARYHSATGGWASPVDVVGFNWGSSPHVAIDATGHATAVWLQQMVAGQFPALLASRWAPGSSTWSTSVLLAPSSVRHLAAPAVDGNGNVLLLWTELVFTGLDRGTVVKWARYAAATATWSAAGSFLGSCGTDRLCDDDLTLPRFLIDAAGDATALWWRSDDSGVSLFSRVFSAASETWSTPRVIYSGPWGTGGFAAPRFRFAIDGAGTTTVVWTQPTRTGGKTRAVRQTRGSPSGVPVTLLEAAELLPPGVSSSRPAPGGWLAVSPSGDVAVLFEDFRSTRWTSTGAEGLSAPFDLELDYETDMFGLVRSGNRLVVTWSPPDTGLAVTGYRLEAGTSEGATDLAVVDLGPAPSLEARVPAVPAFWLRIRALNGATVGPPSNPAALGVFGVCGAVQPPPGLTARVSGNSVVLTWGDANAAESYLLEAGTAPGLSNIVATNVGLANGFSAVAPAGKYYVRVRAVDACGASRPSNEVVVTVAGAAAPGAPTLNAPAVSGSTVSLSWSPGPGGVPAGYTLVASATPGGAPIVTVPLGGLSASFAGVPSGTYYLRLSASNAAGSSPSSTEVALTVP